MKEEKGIKAEIDRQHRHNKWTEKGMEREPVKER